MSGVAVTAYLAGLFAAYFVGLKWGAASKWIHDLGRST